MIILGHGRSTVIITGRNEVVAKVMLLQACVCPRGEGCLPQCMLGYPPRTRHPPRPDTPPPLGPGRTPLGPGRPPPGPGRPPQDQTHPLGPGRTPPDQTDTPPGSRLQQTVYERPVRILLECILVT